MFRKLLKIRKENAAVLEKSRLNDSVFCDIESFYSRVFKKMSKNGGRFDYFTGVSFLDDNGGCLGAIRRKTKDLSQEEKEELYKEIENKYGPNRETKAPSVFHLNTIGCFDNEVYEASFPPDFAKDRITEEMELIVHRGDFEVFWRGVLGL